MLRPPLDTKRASRIAAGVAGVALLAGGFVWWHGKARWEGTDNAYVQTDTVVVSPQVTGYVAEVLVRDNQQVAPGQVLVKLDPAEAQAQLAQAEANLAALEAAVRNVDDRAALERSLVAERQAGVASAQATARLAKTDLDRYGRLAEQGWVAPQRLQSASAQADQAGAAVAQAYAGLEAQRREAASLSSTRAQTLAQVEQARAAVAQARINLDRTVIRAPVGGVVGARAVRPGQYVRPGGQLLAVVPLGRAYVVANFKETQLGEMRVGHAVEVTADAFKGRTFRGRIESFSPATGSEFALIPVENATGNFTKIVQRVPVRIAVEPDGPLAAALRPGLSVKVRVDLKSHGGASFADAGLARVGYAEAGR